jgi:hypothetical protein
MHILLVCYGYLNFVCYICLVSSMVAGIDGGEGCSVRVWREFISQVQVKYCVKEFRGGEATRLKEHLA